MARAKITPKPCGSTSQPMRSSVSGQVYSPEASISARPPSPARNTQAAAPSPKRAVATMLALVRLSGREASVHSSMTTSRILVPGRASAKRAAIENPDTPPAQPSPNTGTRVTSLRKPIRLKARASRLGVAMPVEETVTMVSMSRGARPADSRASCVTRAKSASAPSR
jgi:hypothetical protein